MWHLPSPGADKTFALSSVGDYSASDTPAVSVLARMEKFAPVYISIQGRYDNSLVLCTELLAGGSCTWHISAQVCDKRHWLWSVTSMHAV